MLSKFPCCSLVIYMWLSTSPRLWREFRTAMMDWLKWFLYSWIIVVESESWIILKMFL